MADRHISRNAQSRGTRFHGRRVYWSRAESPQEPSVATGESAENPAPSSEETIPKAKTAKETKTLGPVRVFGEGGVISEQGAGRVQVFDFGASSFLTQRELRQMRQLLEGFVDDLAARLSLFLRIEIDFDPFSGRSLHRA